MRRILCLAVAALGGAFALGYATYDVALSDVPEPSTLVIFGIGLVGLAALARSRNRQSRAAD
jgi:threonine dehydrogenase-like Zn-dependent dehydrogenase